LVLIKNASFANYNQDKQSILRKFPVCKILKNLPNLCYELHKAAMKSGDEVQE